MGKQVAVLGLGRFGTQLARALTGLHHDVLAIDRDDVVIQRIADHVAKAAVADITDLEVLEDLGLGDFEIGVVTTAELEANVLATLNLQSLGVPQVYAKVGSDVHATILQRIGVQRVVFPEKEGGERLAHQIGVPQAQDFLPLTSGYGVGIYAPPAELVGQSLERMMDGAVGTRRLLLLVRDDTVQLNPVLSETIRASDRLVFAGSDEDLAQGL